MSKEYIQTPENNEYRYIQPKWIDAVAEGMTENAKKYPNETWKQIPADEHAARAIRHLNLYRLGDTSENHLVHASVRAMMAFETHKEDNSSEVAATLGKAAELLNSIDFDDLSEKQSNNISKAFLHIYSTLIEK